MAVTTAKIRAREAETGKKAKIGIDNAGNLHYAFDTPTLNSIIVRANNALDAQTSAKATQEAKDLAAYNNSLSQQNASAANAFNAQQAQLNRDFQANMSNTAHQREVADLKAAGLNPVLSAGGSGASSPSGSTASGSPASIDMGATTASVELAKAAINAKTQLQMNRDNITSAQAINNKSLAVQKELGNLGFDNAIATALIAQATSNYAADTAAGASKYGADTAAGASKYGADTAAGASKYSADTAAGASKYGADTAAGASKYASDNSYNASIYATNNPSNPLSNILNSIAGNNDNLSNSGKNIVTTVTNALSNLKNSYNNKKNEKKEYKAKNVTTPRGSLAK